MIVPMFEVVLFYKLEAHITYRAEYSILQRQDDKETETRGFQDGGQTGRHRVFQVNLS